jgi:hypothetical protein
MVSVGVLLVSGGCLKCLECFSYLEYDMKALLMFFKIPWQLVNILLLCPKL